MCPFPHRLSHFCGTPEWSLENVPHFQCFRYTPCACCIPNVLPFKFLVQYMKDTRDTREEKVVPIRGNFPISLSNRIGYEKVCIHHYHSPGK